MPEPANFFEAQAAQEKIAKFSAGGGLTGEGVVAVQGSAVDDKPQEMQMLVAVRMRPLWQKEDDAGDVRCVSVLQGKVVNVVDPWYDEVINPNRQKEKRYAFDVVFDENVGQLEKSSVNTSLISIVHTGHLRERQPQRGFDDKDLRVAKKYGIGEGAPMSCSYACCARTIIHRYNRSSFEVR